MTTQWLLAIPIPDEESRKSIFSINLSKMSSTKINMAKLISETNGFSGADLKATCVEAGMSAIRDSRNKIRMSDYTEAIKVVRNKRLENSAENDSKHLYN